MTPWLSLPALIEMNREFLERQPADGDLLGTLADAYHNIAA